MPTYSVARGRNRAQLHLAILAVLVVTAFVQSALAQVRAPMNWVTGDPHLHAHGCGSSVSDNSLVGMLDRNELNVGSVLVWGDGYNLDLPKFTGEDHPLSRPDHILHYDLEISAFAAGHVGHLSLLGLTDIHFSEDPFSHPTSGLPIVDWALAQTDRVVVGMNHAWAWPGEDGSFPAPGQDGALSDGDSHADDFGGCCQLLEFPVHVANGTASYLEDEAGDFYTDPVLGRLFQGDNSPLSPGATHLWRVLQNCGFRVSITGASDLLCLTKNLGSPNVMRSYLLIDGPISYAAYLDALSSGRTVAALGANDWADFTIGHARLGDEIHIKAGEPMELSISTSLSRAGEMRILANGIPVDSFPVDAGPQAMVRPLTLDESSWVTIQSSNVQTSPIYALVNEQPIRASAEDACYLVRHMDHMIDYAQGSEIEGLNDDSVIAAYQNARDIFLERFLEAGGTSCSSVFPTAPTALHLVMDRDLDGQGDRASSVSSASVNVGQVRDRLNKLVAKFSLPNTSRDLSSAKLRFFLKDVKGTPNLPVSLFHSRVDNDTDRDASDFENSSYVDSTLQLVDSLDEPGAYYELDVTELVLDDYENDDRLVAFRIELAGAKVVPDRQGDAYEFATAGDADFQPELLLEFANLQSDFNRDGQFTLDDLDLLLREVGKPGHLLSYDVDGDGLVGLADIESFVRDESKLGAHMGDTNLDGVVNYADFVLLANNFGSSADSWADGDFDGDQQVSFRDFLILSANFETTNNPSTASVPEPSTAGLFLLAAFLVTMLQMQPRNCS